MLKQDDEHWLNILANQDIPPEANPDTVQEARILREAIQSEERLQQLVSRLKIDGSIKNDHKISNIWKNIFNWQTTYLVTVHAALIVSITIILTSYEQIIIQTDDLILIPKSSKILEQSLVKNWDKPTLESLIQEFKEAGAEIKISSESTQLIEIGVPKNISADLRELFGDYGIEITDSSIIEIINISKQ